jgi:hypothetical protein
MSEQIIEKAARAMAQAAFKRETETFGTYDRRVARVVIDAVAPDLMAAALRDAADDVSNWRSGYGNKSIISRAMARKALRDRANRIEAER